MSAAVIDLEVVGREPAAEGVVTLTLAHPEGASLPQWSPGAHVDLMLSESLVRQYSLCGDASDRWNWRLGVLLDPESRGGSKAIHEELSEGSTLRASVPRNHFPLVESPRYQFIAGGIGITPILTMIEEAEAAGADWQLLYGGRSRASMAFLGELERYGDRVSVCPQDEHGLLDLTALLGDARDDMLVYCCGPEGLLQAVEDACGHWPPGALHVERFAAPPPCNEAAEDALDSFEVECAQSGVTVTVEAGQSIYQALEEADIPVLGSCMEGVCGTCECAVLEGEPLHRDAVLSDSEREAGDVVMVCVSRSRSERLVLDI